MTLYALKQRYFKERQRERAKIHIFLRFQTEQILFNMASLCGPVIV